MRTSTFENKFVRAIPDVIEAGVIYVSIDYRTVVHKCACGCGRSVITPLGPTEWQLIYDGKVSLYPSIGNWRFPCRSHYWIRGNTVAWAEHWSDKQVAAGRAQEQGMRDRFYNPRPAIGQSIQKAAAPPASEPQLTLSDNGFWARVRRWWLRAN